MYAKYNFVFCSLKLTDGKFFQAAVGIELWTMSAEILFDNIIITSDEDAADDWAAKTYDIKRKQIDRESVSNFIDIFTIHTVSKLIKLNDVALR